MEAGLGPRQISIPDVECSPEVFRQVIIDSFPKLASAGGFELMRCVANFKVLEAISQSIAVSPKRLKSVIGKSRIFVRPIQRDLDIEPSDEKCSSAQVCSIRCCYCLW